MSIADAQNITIPVRGRISDQDNSNKLVGVKVSLLHNGSELSSSKTSSNGRYQLQGSGPKVGKYTLVYSKVGYVTKKIQLDLSDVNDEDLPAGNEVPIPDLDIDLFAERENANFEFLDTEPVASFFWDKNNFILDFDRAASNSTKKKIENLLAKSEREAAEKETKYNQAITAGDMYFAQQKYEKAVEKFEESLRYKPEAEYPIEKLDELDALIQAQKEAQLAEQQANAKYNELIEAADQLRDNDKLEEAITKYNEAIAEKDEQYPKDQISLLKLEIEKRKKELENQAKYDLAIKEADQLLTAEELQKSKIKYLEASELKPSEQYPKDKISEIEKLLSEKADKAQKDAEYKKLIDQADALFKARKYENAINKYKEALDIKSEEAYPKDQIELCKRNLDDLKNLAELAENIEKLMKEGDQAMAGENYEVAIGKFEGVLALDENYLAAKEKLAIANNKLNDQRSDEAEDIEFSRLVKKGDDAYTSERYQNAIDAYSQALVIRKVVAVEIKLKDARIKLNEMTANQKKLEQYNKLMSEGAQAVNAKNWEQGKAKYNSALVLYPDRQEPKDKLNEIASLMSNEMANTEKENKYKGFMDDGDNLMSNQDYLGAIKSYNNALSVKPNEREPVEKAAEAQRLAEELNKDADKLYEKILTTAENKARNGDYDRARELVSRAKQNRPQDKRSDEILVLIEELMQRDRMYNKLMADGESFAASEQFEDAKIQYTKAKDLKPDEQLPPTRIAEMEILISERATQAEREALYNQYMSEGQKGVINETYENALNAYKNALNVKPKDQIAKDKIDEVQQILDDILNQKASEQAKKEAYQEAIEEADNFFNDEKYMDAKNAYDEALLIIPGDKYAKERSNESIRLGNARKLAEEEEKYQNILAAADKNFDDENYEEARDYYVMAKDKRSNDPYPQQKLIEIENILNPVIQDSEDLKDLGVPFSGSILEGEELLRKAEDQRSRNKTGAVLTTMDGITAVEVDLTNKKTADHQETTNEIYKITQGIITRSVDDTERLYDNAVTIEGSMTDLERSTKNEIQLEYRETIGNNELIEIIDQEYGIDYGVKKEVYLDNTNVIENYNVAQEKALAQRMNAEQGANIYADQELINIDLGVRSGVVDDYESRENAARLAGEIEIDANTEYESARRKEEIETQKTHVSIDKIETNYERKYAEGHDNAIENTEEFKKINSYLVEKEDYMNLIENRSLNQKDKEVQSKEAIANEAQEGLSRNRELNAEILEKSAKKWDEVSRKNYNEETEKYLTNLDNIDKSIDLNSEIDKVAESALEKKIEYTQQMEKKTLKVNQSLESDDKEDRLGSVNTINEIESDYSSNENAQEDRIRSNAPIANDVEMSIVREQTNIAVSKRNDILNNVDEIDKITDEPKKRTVVVNELGKEYPEGVSQEVFSKQDQNGLMRELITRRIVVVNGRADVYIRTQTSNGTTYSKNGKPSLEHAWQAETQNPKLERHF